MNVAIAIRGLATFAWIATVAVLVLVIQRSARGFRTRGLTMTIIGLVVLAIALTSVGAACPLNGSHGTWAGGAGPHPRRAFEASASRRPGDPRHPRAPPPTG